ncbi:MAG: PSD1 and planctomycete cytochrome C domain-containing protein [Blastocatellia bacterium]|nr:PSD1 and planctomycete cytochrome C domain-containing protein [Blastocatellia bacterium]
MAKKMKLVCCLMLAFAALWLLHERQAANAQAKTVDFARDVEPIFRAHCYECHGPAKASAQLRLDNRQTAMKGGLGGAVILPGKSGESRLTHRVLGHGGEQRMPLGRESLKPEQIETLRKWIDEGAVWPETTAGQAAAATLPKHWAFTAPVRPALPDVKNKTWAKTPIDQFILAEIERQGLSPSPEASKETLLRRLSLDLTGLPPTIREIDAFLADASPTAYEKQVERLLASRHYGERWGRWWLDAARYADTNGFEKDLPRSIWPYRDWVIKAFNQDRPFDQFTIEQLAGDLLPAPTLDQRIATGFLRNSMLNQEGGVDPEQFRVEGLIDRVDAVGKTFLGLTINCAQCHTHKFDPIKQEEYYKFYAFLNSDDEPEIEVPGDEVARKREEILSKAQRIEDELIAQTPDLAQRMVAWEQELRYDDRQWTVLDDSEIFASFGVKFDKLEDGSFIPRGDNSTSNNYKITARTKLRGITGFRIEYQADQNLPRGGPGRAPDGSFYVTEFAAEAVPLDKSAGGVKVAFANATTDFERADFPVKNVIDGNLKTHWSSDAGPGRRNQARKMVFATSEPIGFEGGTLFNFQLIQRFDDTIKPGNVMPNIGRFRISVTTAPQPRADAASATTRRIFNTPAAQRTKEQQRELFRAYRTTVRNWDAANARIDELMKDWPYGPTTMALAPRGLERETRIFRRGDWKRPGEAVKPDTPAMLHPFPAGAPRNRLGLAQWIVDKNNPLTARVTVNRIWQQYFGVGLVTTPEDFGARCERPSHPELLDWLAREFVEKGWSVKQIHRLIVTSAVYRQSSNVPPKLQEADPTNRWLARSPRLRVDSEIIRDLALSVGGVLNLKVGGPPVYPPIPDGVLSLGYGQPMPWPTATGADRYRRAMYTFWKRSVPYPSLLVFDQPNGDFSCARRIRSNTPLQALTTLNDQLFMEAAQNFALRIVKEGEREAGAGDLDKMIYAFRLCTGRKPDAVELQHLMALLTEQAAWFNGRTAAAVYVSSPDLNKIPEDVDLHKIAPWTMVARVLLNMDETITRE